MKRLITLLAALTLTVAAFAQRSLLQPRLEIVEIEADADNAAPFEVFWMEDEGINHYFLSVGNLGIGNNFIQFHVDPLYELFLPLGDSIEEAIETLEMLKEFYKSEKGDYMEMPGCLAIGVPSDELQPIKVTYNRGLGTHYLEFSIENNDVVRATFLTRSNLKALLSGTKFYHKLHPKQK